MVGADRSARRAATLGEVARKSLAVFTVLAVLAAALTVSSAAAGAEPSVIKGIAYAPAQPSDSTGHLLDIYLPSPSSGSAPRPVLIVSGGSGWLAEDGKRYAASVAPHFTNAGFAVVGVSVRSSDSAQFPAQLYDIKSAIRWLRANAGEFGLDPGRFAVWGDSSGGWTATMAAVTGDVPALEGDVGVSGPSSAVQAAVDLYGPTDFLRMTSDMLPGACEKFDAHFKVSGCHDGADSPESKLLGCAIASCPDRVRAADPTTYLGADDPPLLIAHGDRDEFVPLSQSESLFAAVQKACGRAVFYTVPGARHSPRIVSAGNGAADVQATSGCRLQQVPAELLPTLNNQTIENFLRTALDLPAAD